jgi:glycosyltransferase involved in cell wall biosynthesis
MRIGVVVDNDLNGDIRVLREIRILKKEGHDVFVLCFAFKDAYTSPVEGINISRIRIKRSFKNFLFFFLNSFPAYEWFWTKWIKEFIVKHGIEVLHVHDLYMSKSAYRGINGSGKKIPLILDLHENYPFTVVTYNWTKGFLRGMFSRPHDWKKKEQEYLSYADRIIVLSSGYRKDLSEEYPGIDKERIFVFPNAPDLSLPEYNNIIIAKNPFADNGVIIFYYGVIAERRGIFDSLDVFSLIIREGYKANFLLIGPVDKMDRQRFQNSILQEEVSSRIHYIPWINSTEFPSYLAISDICLAPFKKNPQHESGIANKIYDYMLGGKPIIASDCKPQKELIISTSSGLIYSDLQEFHDSLVKLINDESTRKHMGSNGKQAVMNELNTDKTKQNLLSAYNL